MTNIFIANLDWEISTEDLANTFSTFGKVAYAHVVYDRETKKSKGYGYVEMESADSAIAAIQALNGVEINGRRLDVKIASPKGSRPEKQAAPFKKPFQKKPFNKGGGGGYGGGQRREGGGGYQSREGGGGYPRREGGYQPREGGYQPREGGGNREGGYRPRPEGGGYNQGGGNREGGYRPRTEGGGYNSNREGGYRPRTEGGGYNSNPNREGGYRPRTEGGDRPPYNPDYKKPEE